MRLFFAVTLAVVCIFISNVSFAQSECEGGYCGVPCFQVPYDGYNFDASWSNQHVQLCQEDYNFSKGISISGENITLDCGNGRARFFGVEKNGYGISIAGQGNIIRGCYSENYRYGYFVAGGNNHQLIENVACRNDRGYAVYDEDNPDNVLFEANVARDNDMFGFIVTTDGATNLKNNLAEGSGLYGFVVSGGYLTFDNNHATGSGSDGFIIERTLDLIFDRNVANGNGNSGMTILLSNTMSVTGNTAAYNQRNGIVLAVYESFAQNYELALDFSQNTIVDNGKTGILFRGYAEDYVSALGTRVRLTKNIIQGHPFGMHFFGWNIEWDMEISKTFFFENDIGLMISPDVMAGHDLWRFVDNTFVANSTGALIDSRNHNFDSNFFYNNDIGLDLRSASDGFDFVGDNKFAHNVLDISASETGPTGGVGNDSVVAMCTTVEAYKTDFDSCTDQTTFYCGDLNHDQSVNLGDIVMMIGSVYLGGAGADHLEQMDINFDGEVNLVDITMIIDAVYINRVDNIIDTCRRPIHLLGGDGEYPFWWNEI